MNNIYNKINYIHYQNISNDSKFLYLSEKEPFFFFTH